MRLHRFYIEQPLGEELVVEQKELVHQWSAVFRYRDGDKVILFSPEQKGFDYTYQILSIGTASAVLAFVSKKANIVAGRKLALCMALVKKDTFETVVRHATELGISEIVPILASRSEKKGLNLKRLEIIAKEASEQSGRGDLPRIGEIETFQGAFEKRGRERNVFASLHGTHHLEHTFGKDEALNLWIGPEGGWTEEEEAISKSGGAELVKLSETVLRSDTAAVSLVSLTI